jgi:ATP-binding cassette subfamily F protein 3
MSLVTVLKVSLTFFENQIFREIGLQVEPGDRIGLVGPNGSGKTTLLRLLMGEISPDSGEVRVARETRIGYLPQDIQEGLSGPLLQSVIDSIPGRVPLKNKLKKAEQSLKASTRKQEQAGLAETIAEIHHKIDILEQQFPSHEAEKIFSGLGFKETEFDRPISSLSGGWKMRAALASLLYQKPDLLLLDEPTNNLDIPSVRWLEQFLLDFRGAMILVSHDRDFLNRQIHRIVSFEPAGMIFYSGNYDFYLKAREERRTSLEATARKQEQKIKEAQKFIERFRAKASKARQAQSKIKLAKKIRLVETHRKEKTVHFSFPDVSRSGRDVLSIKGVSKGFDERT